ncbi:ABC transporter permease [Luteimonas sp. BDR2-5]|uniref:ABC transporter permease n=1 Tax=Proluteimonas luteida TaxID=2878685 RepID=UPI001E4D707D|nr:FtsX-like permease family protein [Luteimonas sp. BDR2-5]MCD9029923.1 ABC transporter permease [Luteimonas sp. BDR2-5]
MEIRPILSTLRRHKTAAALIVMEIALSCAILCNALFLVVQRLEDVGRPSGIAERELLQIRLSGIGAQDDADARTREDLAALRAIPGVAGVTVTNQLPFGSSSSNSAISLTPEQERPTLSFAQYNAHPGMIDTLGLRLVEGRDFLADEYQDTSALAELEDISTLSSPVIFSADAAKRLFPDGSAVGRTVYMGPIPLTIVGVVETLTRPGAMGGNWSYSGILPLRDNYNNGGSYLIRVADAARRDEILGSAVAELERVDPNRLILGQRSYEEIRHRHFRNDRDMIGLLITVSIALLIVTALGIVGLASFWVQQRSKQIGIRRALGATRGQILRYFQTENFLLVAMGIVLGMLLAYGLNQLLMSRYELPRLPLHYLPIGAVTLWLLGQLAVFWPARRAASVPPAIATRSA